MFGLISKNRLIDYLCMVVDRREHDRDMLKMKYDNGEINEWTYYKHLWNLRGKLELLEEIVNKLGE